MNRAQTRRGRPIASMVLFVAFLISPACMLVADTDTRGTNVDANDDITSLREAIVDAYNKRDIDALLSHLEPDVVITWQNAEVCKGHDSVRAYYDKMFNGPEKIVSKLSANPKIIGRQVHGDWALSWGSLGDAYELEDGLTFEFDSRFTATIARHDDGWKVASFHASVNAFENPILGIAVKKVALWACLIAGVIGLTLGIVIGSFLRRRKAAVA